MKDPTVSSELPYRPMLMVGTRIIPIPKISVITAVIIINTLNFMAFPPLHFG
jgi:hypothetical protein